MTTTWCRAPEIWTVSNRTFCHSGPFFSLLPPCGPRRSKFCINEQLTWRYYHIPNVYHMMYSSWDMKSDRQNVLSFWTVFWRFTPLTIQKIKILKNETKVWRYYQFTHVYHKWQSHDVWFLRYEAWWTKVFVILGCFLPFYPSNNPKYQNYAKN